MTNKCIFSTNLDYLNIGIITNSASSKSERAAMLANTQEDKVLGDHIHLLQDAIKPYSDIGFLLDSQ